MSSVFKNDYGFFDLATCGRLNVKCFMKKAQLEGSERSQERFMGDR